MSQMDRDDADVRLLRLEENLERVSRELRAARRWRWISGLVVVGLIAALVFQPAGGGLASIFPGAEASQMISARGFTLLNKSPQKTAILDNDKYGAPTLAFIDLQKNMRADIRISNDGATGFHLYDSGGKRGRLGLDAEGVTSLELVGNGGKGGIVMSVAADGNPKFQLRDPAGRTIFEAPGPGPR